MTIIPACKKLMQVDHEFKTARAAKPDPILETNRRRRKGGGGRGKREGERRGRRREMF